MSKVRLGSYEENMIIFPAQIFGGLGWNIYLCKDINN
jgi:hypothetical protein